MPTNQERAQWADTALYNFIAGASLVNPSHQDALTDLLVDLMHLAHVRGINFQEVLEIAEAHYSEEFREEHGPAGAQ